MTGGLWPGRPRASRRGACGLVVLVALHSAVPGEARPSLRLRARRLELRRDGFKAEGEVVGSAGACQLRANSLEVGADGRLEVAQGCVRDASALLEAQRVSGSARELQLAWPLVRPCSCGLAGALWLRARAGRWRPAAGRLELEGVTLGVGRVPLFWLPYGSVATRPGTSGMLPPTLGYSARDGVRAALPIYLAWREKADVTLSAGWIGARGASASLRARYFTERRGDGELNGLGVWEDSRWRGWVWGEAFLHGSRWSLHLAPAFATDAFVPADLSSTTALELARYQRSRAWGVLRGEALTMSAWVDLYQPLRAPLEAFGGPATRGQLRIDLSPLHWGPWTFFCEAELTGVKLHERALQAYGAGVVRSGDGAALWWAPSLILQERVGPLRAAASLGYRLRGQWIEGSGARASGTSLQAGTLALEFGLPLGRTYGGTLPHAVPARRWRHELEPYLVAQALRAAGPGPGDVLLLDQRFIVPGYLAGLGVRSDLYSLGGGAGSGIDLDARWLRGERASVAALSVSARARHLLEGQLDALYALDETALLGLRARVCAGPAALLQACFGYLRQRGGLDERELARLASDGAWPDHAGLTGTLLYAERLDVITAGVRWHHSRVAVRAELLVDPLRGALTHGRYGVSFVDRCGCLEVGLSGRSRPAGGVPDLMLDARIDSAWGAACLAPGAR